MLFGLDINDIKTTLEVISPLVLMYAAVRALWQLGIMQEQNSLSRETLAINELREFEKLIRDFEDLNEFIQLKNINKIELNICEMEDFSMKELSKDIFKNNLAKWNLFYRDNRDAYSKAVSCTNKLEVIATALNGGTAKLEIIKDAVAPTFCTLVEKHAYIYIRNRNKAISLYNNTIALYKKFKPAVKTVNEQISLIESETKQILSQNDALKRVDMLN